jgi:sulfhydrogenase subunit beta (sulfur reductase)
MSGLDFLPRDRFQDLINALVRAGYRCIGPRVRDGAIVYADIERMDDLPHGVQVDQEPGSYRVGSNGGPRWFSWANGPQALKPLLFASREPLWRSQRDAEGAVRFSELVPSVQPLAVIGVRACDLAALRLHDQHFIEGPFPDPGYAARRAQLLTVAVNCTHPAATCFCTSTGDGPRAGAGADIVLSEVDEGFVAQARGERGRVILAGLGLETAGAAQVQTADAEIETAACVQKRHLPSQNLRAALFARLDHPRWEQVGARCLACGSCTAVCPTCFCHSEGDEPALAGDSSVRARLWDSCFTQGHSYIHGLTIRAETRMRYRQWLTHKLGSWHEQYGRSGCVGCGRCITWCPVGIDITEEANAICGEVENG